MDRGPLRHANLFHTGIVVDDLRGRQGAVRRAPRCHLVRGRRRRPDDHRRQRTVRAAYALSKRGPTTSSWPSPSTAPCGPRPGPGRAHHLGYWVDDVTAASAALTRLGAPRIASIAAADDAPPMCAYHEADGLYVEIVSQAMRSVLLPSR